MNYDNLIKDPSRYSSKTNMICRLFWTAYKGKSTTLRNIVSTEHSSSELRVIGTHAHRVDSYFLHLIMHNLTLLWSQVNPYSRWTVYTCFYPPLFFRFSFSWELVGSAERLLYQYSWVSLLRNWNKNSSNSGSFSNQTDLQTFMNYLPRITGMWGLNCFQFF